MLPAVKAKIISMQQSFTQIETEIAQYILDNFDVIADAGISQLASNTKTSDASVNRFCKKLGYKGFNSFKIAVVQESFYDNISNKVPEKKDGSYLQNLVYDYSEILINASGIIDESEAQKFVELIKSSSFVHIICNYQTVIVGQELERRLSAIGIKNKLYSDPVSVRYAAIDALESELCLVLTSSILIKELYTSIMAFKNNKVKIGLITNYDTKQAKGLASAILIITDKTISRNALAITNNLMYFLAIDLIFTMLFASDKLLRQRKFLSETIANQIESIDSILLDS